jgi:hypothetical protein
MFHFKRELTQYIYFSKWNSTIYHKTIINLSINNVVCFKCHIKIFNIPDIIFFFDHYWINNPILCQFMKTIVWLVLSNKLLVLLQVIWMFFSVTCKWDPFSLNTSCCVSEKIVSKSQNENYYCMVSDNHLEKINTGLLCIHERLSNFTYCKIYC